MENSCADVLIGITGLPNSGKTTLVSKMNNYLIQIPKGRLARLIVDEYDESEADLKKYDLLLVLFPLDGASYIRALQMALDVKRRAPHVCMVGTKPDLIPGVYSLIDVNTRSFRPHLEYEHELPYFTVSPLHGDGMEELRRFAISIVHPLGLSVRKEWTSSLRIFMEKMKAWVLDTIAIMFSLPLPKNVNEKTPDSLELTDDAVKDLLYAPYSRNWDKMMAERHKDHKVYKTGLTAYRITPTLIAKYFCRSEAANMEYVRKQTKIPVPQPRYPHLKEYMVMDFVEGRTLLECWEDLSAFMKFRVACTLRTYLMQLRRLTRDIPGTVDGGIVSGMLFENEPYGPFDSPNRFRAWCEMVACTGWGRYVSNLKMQNPDHPGVLPPKIDDNWLPYVFAHHDLHLGNIILADDGTLWLIDWSYSGFFPRCMDSVVLGFYSDAPMSWKRYRRFISGVFPSYDKFWGFFADDVHRYRQRQVAMT